MGEKERGGEGRGGREPASANGLEGRFSLSLPKATNDPVAVTPPMMVASEMEPWKAAHLLSGAKGSSSSK